MVPTRECKLCLIIDYELSYCTFTKCSYAHANARLNTRALIQSPQTDGDT